MGKNQYNAKEDNTIIDKDIQFCANTYTKISLLNVK
jgi:hypothetical protein